MKDKQINAIIGITFIVAAILVLAGAFFRIRYYPNGSLILLIGAILGTAATVANAIRLKRKNKELEEQLKQNK